jgi:hypothetical protein
LLRKLYEDEFSFAQLADSSDLVARFTGPAVSHRDPTVTIVAGVFSDLRDQIRGIAKSIVGLSDSRRLRWPSELDPHLAGIAHGSLVIGVSIPKPLESDESGQVLLPGISDAVYESVRSAVRSLSNIARYIGDEKIDERLFDEYPDPAVRDTVMVAASRLAPSGRRGIESVTFMGPNRENGEIASLTTTSRRILNHVLAKPIRTSGTGSFEGIVREIDLDAHRFEIRRVQGAGSIRCVYAPQQQERVRQILDALIRVTGSYETQEDSQPRLVAVDSIEILRAPEEQLRIELESGS